MQDRPVSTHKQPYDILARRYLWQSRWYHVRQDTLGDATGGQFTYTVIEKPAAVWVVPVTAGGNLVLIHQYRYAVDDWCLEVPAGNVEPGVDPAVMAARELHEEIGGTAERLIPVADFYTMNGIGDEIAWVYLALGVTLGQPHREPTELIELRAMPLAEGLRLARAGQIKDGPSALALLLCEPALRLHCPEWLL